MRLAVPPHTVATYRRGDDPVVQAGDVLLVRHHGLAAALIRWACRLRRPRGVARADWRRYCRVNHACVALTAGADALVAQATARGIVVTPLDELDYFALGVVTVEASPDQFAAALAFAVDSEGTGYGFLQIPADLVNAATGLELSLGFGDRMVCSTATARCLERTDYIPDRSPDCITPPHLAWHFGVVVEAV